MVTENDSKDLREQVLLLQSQMQAMQERVMMLEETVHRLLNRDGSDMKQSVRTVKAGS